MSKRKKVSAPKKVGGMAITLSLIVGLLQLMDDGRQKKEMMKQVQTTLNSANIVCDKVIDKNPTIDLKICYDYKHNGASMVQYTLQGDLVNKRNISKRPRFYREKKLSEDHQIRPSDYVKTTGSETPSYSYDLGHLAPDAAFDHTKRSLLKVYTMANVVPQEASFNRGVWADLEMQERAVAVDEKKATVTILCLYGKNHLVKKSGMSMKRYVGIPDSFIKIIDSQRGRECYFMMNKPTKKPFTAFRVDCESIVKRLNSF